MIRECFKNTLETTRGCELEADSPSEKAALRLSSTPY
jgi:hypothetical protein